MNVTPKQLEILRLIRDFRNRHGYSPTMQELADHLEVSKVTVFQHVEALEVKGLLHRHRHRARSLALTKQVQFHEPSNTVLPLMGYIAAGAPIEAIQSEERFDIGSLFQSFAKVFLLQVRGNSMIDEQIRDGDLVVVRPESNPRNGQTVVALLDDGEATLKRFYREGKRVRLQPANDAYAPIYVPVERLTIQGVVVGIIRNYAQ